MADKTFLLQVVTPERSVAKAEVEFASAPGAMGRLGILAQHAPLVTSLDIGVLRYTKGGEEAKLAINGGFLEVGDNKMTVLASSAEKAEEIDITRAEAARRRAEERIAEAKKGNGDIDLMRAEVALKRAINRLNIKNGL